MNKYDNQPPAEIIPFPADKVINPELTEDRLATEIVNLRSYKRKRRIAEVIADYIKIYGY